MKISTTLDATLISRSDKWRLDIKIDDQKFSITAERFNDDSLTITTEDGHNAFKFDHSDPDTVRAIGEMLLKASEL